jgi:sarcosine oxidase subunit alpha
MARRGIVNKRLPPLDSHWIDREHPIPFRFEGHEYQGYQGDVLSSALWGAGCRVLGRSFKYHRPRGVYSLAGHDANVMLEDGVKTNIRGDQLLLADGMNLRAVNTAGGVERDRLKWMGAISRFLPVGFYYKAFHTPGRLFPFFERQMRKVAGLGSINPDSRPQASPKDYAFCDLLVVGSGPAGLSAATAAARQGLQVMLVEEQQAVGGSLCWQWTGNPTASQMLVDRLSEIQQLDNIELRCGTQAAGWYADHWVALVDDRRLTKLRARATLLATGCIEQPAVFQNNDLPGVMLSSAAQRLMHLYAVAPCQRAVILAAGVEGYQLAAELLDLGITVAAIADLRPAGEPSSLAEEIRGRGVAIYPGHTVSSALAGRGNKSVRGALIAPLANRGNRQPQQRVPCDGILLSVGWSPNAALVSQAGGRFRYSSDLHQLVPSELPDDVFVAGRVNGIFNLQDQVADGQRAGLAAAARLGAYDGSLPDRPAHQGPAPSHPYPVFPHPGKKNFVDLDEDLHLVDFANAHQEGYDNVELLKRFTTVGMGPSQGKLSNFMAVRILASLNNASIDNTGTTTSRPFYQPVSLGHLAGRRFHPQRRTALDDWHRQAGAVMIHSGGWLRPEFYQQDGESREESILAEAEGVRAGAGLIDVSTLGKIHICGSQAAEFLERIYTGRFKKQRVGTLRYGVACDETGVIIEDGVVARLSEDHFYVSATSSGAAAFYRNLQRWALQFGMPVTLGNATGQLAAFNLAGPAARQILQPLVALDLSADSLPYLGVRQAEVLGVPATLLRVGFVGELGYEIHLPINQAHHVWVRLLEQGSAAGLGVFGLEAQRLLRLEKGHLIVGHDTDALTNPMEADLNWAVAQDKPFFVGGRSLQIVRQQPLGRKLVGLRLAEGHQGPWPEECHLLFVADEVVGRITSISARSTLGYGIAMGFIRPELARPGTQVEVQVTDGTRVKIEVVELPFYDPDNDRQRLE